MKYTVKHRPSSKVMAAKAPYQVNELIKEIQDTVYNVAYKYLKAEGWDTSDVADYFVADVQEVETGVIRVEIRGELEYEQLSELCNQLDKVIAVKFDKDAYFEPVDPGIAEAFIRTNVNACSNVTASLNYVTPEMKQLKRAISKIYVDNDDQFHELVDSLLNNEPINLVPETRALKRAIDSLIVDSEEERRTLVYEVAKDLGVINSSSNVDVYSADDISDMYDDGVDDIEREFQRIDRSGTDEDVEIAAIMYNLGTTMKEAREILPTLSKDKIKDYVDYYYLRDLPAPTRLKLWNSRKNISSSSTVVAGTKSVYIDHYNAFDNGKVLRNFQYMTEEQAQEAARQASIKDPTDAYYVHYDDVMNPGGDIVWVNGVAYRDMDVSPRGEGVAIRKGAQPVEAATASWDEDDSQWIKLNRKYVLDSDGFYTDYTLYTNGHEYICMFGDEDIYGPDPDYADFSTDSEEEALEWFDSYEGMDEGVYAATDNELEHPDQEYDSAATSINSTKLPAIYKLVNFEPGKVYLDFGGGKFDNGVYYVRDLGATLLVYDPYNRSDEHNKEVLRVIRENGGADATLNSNVLNVIKEPEARLAVLKNIKKLTKPSGDVYITVYEGTGKGNEGPTKAGYQLNRKTANYLEEVQSIFPDAQRKGKLIHATNSGSVSSSRLIRSNCKITSAASASRIEIDAENLKGKSIDEIEQILDDAPVGSEVIHIRNLKNRFNRDVAIRKKQAYKSNYFNPVGAPRDFNNLDTYWELGGYEDPYIDSTIYKAMNGTDKYYGLTSEVLKAHGITSSVQPVASANNVGYSSFQDPRLEPPEPKELEKVDASSEEIEISLDKVIITVNEDGSWEYDDESYPWAANPDNKYGDWYSEDYNVYLDDTTGVVEKFDEIAEPFIPGYAGRYQISCDATLIYNVSGVEVDRDYFQDKDGDILYNDEEVYIDDAEVEFDSRNSFISNFKYSEIE